MAITRTLGAIPYRGWAISVPLVLVGNVVAASLAWWLVGSMFQRLRRGIRINGFVYRSLGGFRTARVERDVVP
jgi:hypothetical protein